MAVIGEILLPLRGFRQGLLERAIERALVCRPDERSVGNGLTIRQRRRARVLIDSDDGGAGDDLAAPFANRAFQLFR